MRSKNSKKKLLIALVTGIAVSFMVFNSINGLNQKLQDQQNTITKLQSTVTAPVAQSQINQEPRQVVVAKTALKSGTQITADMVEINKIKPQDVPSDSLSDIPLVTGRTLASDIKAGDVITRSKLLDVNYVPIPKGYRTIAIPANKIIGLSPDFNVGTRVDILFSKTQKNDNGGKNDVCVAHIVAENIQIASITNSRDSFTFLIPFKKTTAMYQALSTAGSIELAMRNNNDPSKIDDYDTNASAIRHNNKIHTRLANLKIMPVKFLPPLPSEAKSVYKNYNSLPEPVSPVARFNNSQKVEIIQANVKSQVTFDD